MRVTSSELEGIEVQQDNVGPFLHNGVPMLRKNVRLAGRYYRLY